MGSADGSAEGVGPLSGGRLKGGQDPLFQELNCSLAFDRLLWREDLACSGAHARLLSRIGLLSGAELARLEEGLARVAEEFERDSFEFRGEDEDIHLAIERRLGELIGPLAGKLHTGRSRNDQVATDLMLHVRGRARRARALLLDLLKVLLARAEEHLDWPAPGYTHLQRAQPLYLSHHLLAYFWMFLRDERRFQAVEEGCDLLPLGAGALAGSGFGEERRELARELGFRGVAPNSLDAVSDRDYVLDYLGAAAICQTHLSRLGGELVVWSSAEFGFLQLADRWTATSSLMPQKKNPDGAELLRAKAPRVASQLVRLHGVLHGLPLGYHKDLQEDKEPLFDAARTVELCLQAARGMVQSATFNREALERAAFEEGLGATELADLLVRAGMAFREAHRVVGQLVRKGLEEERPLRSFGADELMAIDPLLGREAEAVARLLGERTAWLESKRSEGGTALPRVKEQLALARERFEARISALRAEGA